jgi:hypothetical protein
MINPIEVNHRNTLEYVKLLKRAAAGLTPGDLPQRVKFSITQVKVQLKNIENTYKVGATSHLVKYYTNQEDAVDSYWAFINSSNIPGILSGCLRRLKFISTHVPELSHTISKCDQYDTISVVRKIDVSKCECGTPFVICDSEKWCRGCAMLQDIYGEAMEVNDSGDGNKPKQGRHYPNAHFRLWIGRIQAWEIVAIPPKVISGVKECYKRDDVNRRILKCKQIRKYLKEIGETKHNDHVPLIRKIVSGISPPQFTNAELTEYSICFDKIVVVLKRIRPSNNITYYPYAIYKIIDSFLKNTTRKMRILECIHLQSAKTMKFIDSVYETICQEVPELISKPTDRHEYDLIL